MFSNVFAAMLRVAHKDLYDINQIDSDYATIAAMPSQCAELVRARISEIPENARINLFAQLANSPGSGLEGMSLNEQVQSRTGF